MTTVREIKIRVSEDSEPYTFKFSDEVDLEDIKSVLQEAIENFSIQNHVIYEAFDPRSFESINLNDFPQGGIETILLNEKGKSPEKFKHNNSNLHDDEIVMNGHSSGKKQTPNKVFGGAHAHEDRDKSPGRAGIANQMQMSMRNTKPVTESVVQSLILSKARLVSKNSEGYGNTINTQVGNGNHGDDVVRSELDALYERSIRTKENEIETNPRKIDLEADHNKQGGSQNYYDPNPKNTEKGIQHTFSLPYDNSVASKWNTGTIGTTPRDGNHAHIYSHQVGHPPFTFSLAGYGYNEKMPPPLYLPYNDIKVLKPLDMASIFKGQDVTKDGELKITDKESLKNQEGIVGDVLKRLAASIAAGRGVVGVSLPIRIFEPRSLVERITDWWAFAPVYLTPGAQKVDPLERFKSVIAFAMSGLYVSVSPFKPFNPILGETYQGEFPGHGISVNVEHTSHHPPIANFYVVHKDWKYYGRYEFKGDISTFHNCLTVDQEGPNTIEFSDGHKITFQLPTIRIGGMIHGDKTTRYKGLVKFVDHTNRLKCVIKFDPSDRRPMYEKRRKDVYSGLIYRYKQGVVLKKEADEEKMKDMEEKIEEVHGQWLKQLYFGETKWWDINEQAPVRTVPVENPLSSDWRFREDLIWVKRGDRKIGETWKLFLEVRQREEKKFREAGKKHRK